MTLEEKKTEATKILMTEISWYADDRGTLLCPGHTLHTKPTGLKDTILYLDGVPTLFCYHESCREQIDLANKALRTELAPRSPEQREEARVKTSHLTQLSCDARKLLANKKWLLEKYNWTEIFEGSWVQPFQTFITAMWDPEDYIWVGEVWDTGPIKGPGHFKPAGLWDSVPGHFTTACSFKPGTIDRCMRQIERSPYTVVEFDVLNVDKEVNRIEGAAFINYLSKNGLNLRAVVDSGNKSIHGWFEAIPDDMKFFIRCLGGDAKTMRPSQAVRVPGAIRENGNTQSLLWISQ